MVVHGQKNITRVGNIFYTPFSHYKCRIIFTIYTFSHLKRPFYREKKIRKCKINRRAYPLGIVSLTPIVLLNNTFSK